MTMTTESVQDRDQEQDAAPSKTEARARMRRQIMESGAVVRRLTAEDLARLDNRELAAFLMSQAVKAAIQLIDGDQPQLAVDVLRLAGHRWEEAKAL
jgi:hypothetical protein